VFWWWVKLCDVWCVSSHAPNCHVLYSPVCFACDPPAPVIVGSCLINTSCTASPFHRHSFRAATTLESRCHGLTTPRPTTKPLPPQLAHPVTPNTELMSSRDSSPTSPLYSPLTPAHDDEEEQQYLEMSAQEADYDNYLQSLQHSSSDEDDDESTLSDMPTDTHGDTIVFSSDDTPQTSQPEQKSSDRAAGFHEETARKRQATRDDAEEVCAGQSDSELKRAPIEHEENDTRQEQGEGNGEKEVAVENPIELKAEREMVPPARSQAPWVSDAVAACKANKRVCLSESRASRFHRH
jgi:hypothetical protein